MQAAACAGTSCPTPAASTRGRDTPMILPNSNIWRTASRTQWAPRWESTHLIERGPTHNHLVHAPPPQLPGALSQPHGQSSLEAHGEVFVHMGNHVSGESHIPLDMRYVGQALVSSTWLPLGYLRRVSRSTITPAPISLHLRQSTHMY